MEKIKAAIIGYGGIARVHNTAYQRLAIEGYPVELVAVCERDISRVTAKLDFNLGGEDTPLPESVHLYTNIDELIANEDFDLADICLPTFLHRDVAIRLMNAGKHVICEKPMALSSEDCDLMIKTAEQTGRKLMIAHCLRFDGAYNFLRDCVLDRRFGKLNNLYLDRHSVYPTWGTSFNDNSRTGGLGLDTHVHDVDIALYILGAPHSVSAVEFNSPPNFQVMTSTLYYDGTTVVANGSWDSAYSVPFRAGFRARFERATVLLENGELSVIPNGGEPYNPELAASNYTVEELRHILDAITDGAKITVNPPKESRNSVRMIELLRESAKNREIVNISGKL